MPFGWKTKNRGKLIVLAELLEVFLAVARSCLYFPYGIHTRQNAITYAENGALS
jgi:hypothetical protein